MRKRSEHAEFEHFVHSHWTSLMLGALAVSASRVEAEDLLQTALTNMYVRWAHIRPEQRLPYARRTILNANISRWRRHRGRESVMSDVPDSGSPSATDEVDINLSLVALLRQLPDRQRGVLVLRYLYDLPDDQIARTLGISTGTVRSQASRALRTLRSMTDAHPATALNSSSSLSRAEEAR